MRSLYLVVSLVALFVCLAGVRAEQTAPATQPTATQPAGDVPAVLAFTVKDIDGREVPLGRYAGKVVLIVNVASKCGLTPQYKALQALHEKYAERGLVILAFPANNFGNQEPGTEAEIRTFCETKYGVKFPLFAKISVKGDNSHPLYRFLTSSQTNGKLGGEITWNFEKFLVSREGKVVQRFAPRKTPDSEEVVRAIEAQLAMPAPAQSRR